MENQVNNQKFGNFEPAVIDRLEKKQAPQFIDKVYQMISRVYGICS